jgi:hypothetical protein
VIALDLLAVMLAVLPFALAVKVPAARKFLSGAPMFGQVAYHTDATFWKPPGKIKHQRGTLSPHWWHWRPGWHRSAMRLAAYYVTVVIIPAGLILAPSLTLLVLACSAAGLLAKGGWWFYRKVRRWWPQSS